MKILVVYYALVSFIENDIKLLRKHYEVEGFALKSVKDIPHLAQKIKSADLVISWFGAVHAGIATELARIFRKKSIIIVGGYDAHIIKEFNYGLWANGKWHHKFISKRGIKDADKVIAVSEFTKNELLKNTGIKREIKIIYNGADPQFWRPNGKKKNKIITVAAVKDWVRAKVKGLDIFIEVAKSLPDYNFEIIGPKEPLLSELKDIAPGNVEITGFMPPTKLKEKYQQAKVYVQLSRVESFSVSTIEAMLCGCVPVITNVGALPEVVQNYAYYVPYGDIKKTRQAILNALNSKINPRQRALYFSLEKRELNLLKIIKEVFRDESLSGSNPPGRIYACPRRKIHAERPAQPGRRAAWPGAQPGREGKNHTGGQAVH